MSSDQAVHTNTHTVNTHIYTQTHKDTFIQFTSSLLTHQHSVFTHLLTHTLTISSGGKKPRTILKYYCSYQLLYILRFYKTPDQLIKYEVIL